jgi:hypothetical protein
MRFLANIYLWVRHPREQLRRFYLNSWWDAYEQGKKEGYKLGYDEAWEHSHDWHVSEAPIPVLTAAVSDDDLPVINGIPSRLRIKAADVIYGDDHRDLGDL